MSHADSHHDSSGKLTILGIGLVLLLYGISAFAHWPQNGTELIVQAHEHPSLNAPVLTPPGYLTIIPFVLLLGSIAVLPLINKTKRWWESNLNRFIVAVVLGFFTLFYYLKLHGHAIESHWPAHKIVEPTEGFLQWQLAWTVLANAILYEYIPFIVLLFALYTISGGIRITGDVPAHPLTNTGCIALGGLLASFIGTTGAAMLLIRPLLVTNSERKHVRHTVIFFIFVVCNCGGLLLPIGDPPLFLGYLRDVPFTWTLTLWGPWLFVNGLLLLIYWAWDHFFCYPTETKKDIVLDETRVRRLRISGLAVNGPLLIGVIFSVALLVPSKPFPGTDWNPWMYLREIVQLALVGASLLLGSREVRHANRFNFHAILEVAALFLGIFICMQPALQILGIQGKSLGLNSSHMFFWITGGLSAVLDNAPTYVVFFETAKAMGGEPMVAGVNVMFLKAISLGAVFMGAMTYIGNGPNFMVKAIAEYSGISMPSFFGFMLYSCLILLPILLVMTFIFL